MSSISAFHASDLNARVMFHSTYPGRGAASVGVLLWVVAVCGGCSMRNLIYPAPGVQVGAPPPGFEEVVLGLDDGSEVVGWHRPQPRANGRPVMIFFHGNGENLETMKWAGLYGQLAALELPLVVVDYPGYGRSTGHPSEESLKNAAATTLSWTRERYPRLPVVPCGWSLGAALAIHLAAVEPQEIQGVVAISAWTSLHELAKLHFPGWLVSVGLREKYDSLAAAVLIDSPALVIHGSGDRIISVAQGRRLATQLKNAKFVAVEGAGHNDLLSFSAVWQEIDDFVSGLRAPAGV